MLLFQQIQVIVIALAFSLYVLYKVRVAKLDLRYAITWLLVMAGVLSMAAFPRAVLWLANYLGFEAGTNMVFIAALAVLAIIVFRQTIKMSDLEKRIVTLTQTIAILRHEKEKQEEQQNQQE
jgi:hypothetical protein